MFFFGHHKRFTCDPNPYYQCLGHQFYLCMLHQHVRFRESVSVDMLTYRYKATLLKLTRQNCILYLQVLSQQFTFSLTSEYLLLQKCSLGMSHLHFCSFKCFSLQCHWEQIIKQRSSSRLRQLEGSQASLQLIRKCAKS